MIGIILGGIVVFLTITAFFGIRVVRPTHVGLIETLGKYTKTATFA